MLVIKKHFLFLQISLNLDVDLSRRFIRNPNEEEFNAGKRLIFKGDLPTPDESEYF